MCVRIYQHLVSNNMSVDEQNVFRINSSTVKAAQKLLNTILNELNNKKNLVVYSATHIRLLIVLITKYCLLN